jgi:hypothetical protein
VASRLACPYPGTATAGACLRSVCSRLSCGAGRLCHLRSRMFQCTHLNAELNSQQPSSLLLHCQHRPASGLQEQTPLNSQQLTRLCLCTGVRWSMFGIWAASHCTNVMGPGRSPQQAPCRLHTHLQGTLPSPHPTPPPHTTTPHHNASHQLCGSTAHVQVGRRQAART